MDIKNRDLGTVEHINDQHAQPILRETALSTRPIHRIFRWLRTPKSDRRQSASTPNKDLVFDPRA